MPSPNTTTTIVKATAAIAVSVSGLIWSSHLLANGLVNQLSFISLVAIWLLVSLFILFSHRIKILNLRQLSIELERVEEARKEIEKREKCVTEMARIIGEMTDKNISQHGLLFGEATIEENKKWMTQKNAELKALVGP